MSDTYTGWKNGLWTAVAVALALPCCTPVSAADVDPGPLLNPMAAVQRSSLTSFVERPLFEPMRGVQPPVPVVEEPPPAPIKPEAPPSLRVVGIVQGVREGFAVIARQDSNAVETVRTGDHLGIWHVAVRETDLVLSSSDGASARYQLFSPK